MRKQNPEGVFPDHPPSSGALGKAALDRAVNKLPDGGTTKKMIMLSPIPNPDDILVKLALILGAPVSAVLFFYAIWQVVQWFQAMRAVGRGLTTMIETVKNWNSPKAVRALKVAIAHGLYVIGGLYLSQCFQFVTGVPYANGDANSADRTTLKPSEFFDMIYFRPFLYTATVAAVLIVIATLSLLDLMFDSEISLIPRYVSYLVLSVMGAWTALALVPAVIISLTCLMALIDSKPFKSNQPSWALAVTYIATGLAWMIPRISGAMIEGQHAKG